MTFAQSYNKFPYLLNV